MSIDKKSSYIGNHGGTYTDLDGQSKQFTYIDHDIKTKKSFSPPLSDDEKSNLKEGVKEDLRIRIEAILSLPAVSLLKSKYSFAEDFVIRDVEKGIIWNETYTKNTLSLNSDLAYSFYTLCWKNTVREQYWNEYLSDKDIISKKWIDWI